MHAGPGVCNQASASVAKEGGASAVPRYKTGLDSAGVFLCWRPGWAAEIVDDRRGDGRVFSNDPGM